MRSVIVGSKEEAARSIYLGWHNALISKGVTNVIWEEHEKPAFDLFMEYQPDTIFLNTKHLTEALVKCILKFKPVVYLQLNNWGAVNSVSNQEVELTQYIVPLVKKCHTHILELASEWDNIGLKPIQILPGFDSFRYKPMKPFDVDFCYVGGYGLHVDILIKLANEFNGRFFGYGAYPTPLYVGKCLQENENRAHSGVSINVVRPGLEHSINERPFKTIGCGGHLICQDTPQFRELWDLPYFSDYDKLVYHLKNQTKQKIDISQHTYVKRMEQLLGA